MNPKTQGTVNGLMGVLIFSASLPATRVAVADLDPVFLSAGRASIAAAVSALLLLWVRAPRPSAAQWRSLALVAIGVVLGFPLLTALALQHMNSANAIVFIGALPIATAVFAVWRAGERPSRAFWVFSLLGSAVVMGYALAQGFNADARASAMMVAAVVVCGMGYAEGGRLARSLGGWQVISWALVLSMPFALVISAMVWPTNWQSVRPAAWWGFAYVSLFSMLIGFIFWYRGLAQGGIAAIGQLQLLQPFFGLALARLLLNEPLTPAMLMATVAVVFCVFAARKWSHRYPPNTKPSIDSMR